MYETATRSVDKLLRPFLYRALQIKQNLKKPPKLPGMRSEKSSFYSQVAMKYAKHWEEKEIANSNSKATWIFVRIMKGCHF